MWDEISAGHWTCRDGLCLSSEGDSFNGGVGADCGGYVAVPKSCSAMSRCVTSRSLDGVWKPVPLRGELAVLLAAESPWPLASWTAGAAC